MVLSRWRTTRITCSCQFNPTLRILDARGFFHGWRRHDQHPLECFQQYLAPLSEVRIAISTPYSGYPKKSPVTQGKLGFGGFEVRPWTVFSSDHRIATSCEACYPRSGRAPTTRNLPDAQAAQAACPEMARPESRQGRGSCSARRALRDYGPIRPRLPGPPVSPKVGGRPQRGAAVHLP